MRLRLPPCLLPLFRAAAAARGAAAPARSATTRAVGGEVPPTIGLARASLASLRASRDAYVDKTSALADLLAGGMCDHPYAFFARLYKFGKSLTLDVAAKILAAGALPEGVAPWPGYVPVDIDAVFGGLAVHERLRACDPTLRDLLQRAHFVIHLGLGGVQKGPSG